MSALLLAGSASGGNNAHALQGVDGCEILSGRQASKCEEYGDLISADLTDALLTRADLTRSDLTDADLTDALLTGADLSGADLDGADLTEVDLTRADLSGANLAGADLYRVFGWETVKGKTAIRSLDAAHGVPGG
ncbi:pentapeptide repeat-containing protein [uncultured Ilumatobacter sp.]|uniref:pentapeptide repeat-containing protein n=1 Tax=uncultured Ilumatobacter sp. TaxID=879968 RepID=UPI00374F6207